MALTTTPEKETSLTSAIEQAMETHESDVQDATSTSSDTSTTNSDDTSNNNESTEEATQEVESALDEDAVKGRELIQALRDPEKAAILIDFLATRNGYTKQQIADATKSETREIKADFSKILEEELGAEFKFLAPKFGKAFERFQKELRSDNDSASNETVQELKERVERTERREIETEIGQVHKSLSQVYFAQDDMPANVVAEMNKAMDRIPADPNQSPSEYYKDVFNYVVGKLGLQKKTSGSADRLQRSRADAPARTLSATNRGLVGESRRPSKMNLTDAISSAVEDVEKSLGARKN